MKNRKIKFAAAGLALFFLTATIAFAQTTAFTYQGRLTDNNAPASGQYDLQFRLFDVEAGGTQLGSTIIVQDVQVTNGVFTVSLDFGSVVFTTGAARVIEIAVRPGAATGAFTTLSPVQPLTATPYAVQSLNATQLGGFAVDQFVQASDSRLNDARLPTAGSGFYIQNRTSLQSASNFSISGTGAASIFNATTQYNLGGNRVLSVAGGANIFAGIEAGVANTTGINNSFFGSFAGLNNTTGSDNSFFGSAAGLNNTTGSSNLFVGRSAGLSNSSGDFNSFFGKAAGFGNTTGLSNSFFGENSGRTNTTGNDNSFVGREAGFNNTAGLSNSFFGRSAGTTNTMGSNNTIIGANANVGANNLTFAAALGSGAIVNASNTVVLGRNLDTVQVPGNLSVTGTFTGNINGSSITNLNASNIASGTLDNARLGVVGVANGGTGLSASGAANNFLRSNGTAFTSSALAATDIPSGSANYIQNTTTQQAATNFSISGNGTAGGVLSGNTVNSVTQYNINGSRVLSLGNAANTSNTFVGLNAGNISALNGSANNLNTFVGSSVGSSTTSGGNSFFGGFAGSNNTTGSNNTIIGMNANVGESNLTNATALGAGAIVSTSNTVVLGRAADTVRIPGNLDIQNGTIPESELGVAGMGFMGRATFGGAGIQFFSPNGTSTQSSVGDNVEMLTPNRACTAQNLSVQTTGTLSSGFTWIFTLLVNGVSTPVSCTVSSSSASCNSGVATIGIPAGQKVSIRSNKNENTTQSFMFGWECR